MSFSAFHIYQKAQNHCFDSHAMYFIMLSHFHECVAGPILMRAEVKKSGKIHPLKVKETKVSTNLP